MAGWLGLCLGLYALGDSLVALFGVTLIRDRSARLEDIRQLRRCRGTDSRAEGGPRAPAVLAADRGVAVICGVLGLWSLRSEWFRHTSVPLDAVVVGGVAAYILRLLFLGQRSTSFQTYGRV